MNGEEDAALNDFFAKKDKGNKPKKKKKTKSDDKDLNALTQGAQAQGDDWNDFEVEKEKDYSSLQLTTLAIAENNAKEENSEESFEGDGDEEDGGKKQDSTKWNVPAQAAPQPVKESAPELPGTQNVVGGKYVPPSVKRSNMMSMNMASSRKPLAAPDIQSKAAFPTLGAAHQDLKLSAKSSDFEAVKGGIKTQEARMDDKKPMLALGNRYDSLS